MAITPTTAAAPEPRPEGSAGARRAAIRPPAPAAQLDAVLASAIVAIFSTDLDGTITNWNPAAERIYGWTAKEAIGQSITTLVPPEEVPRHDQMAAAAAGGQTVTMDLVRRWRSDGTTGILSVTLAPIFGDDGDVVAIAAIARDQAIVQRTSAALVSSEARFHQVMETSLVGACMLDPVGRMTYANRSLADLLRMTRDDLAGRMFTELIAPEDLPAARRWIEGRGSGDQRPVIGHLRRPDGSEAMVRYAANSMFGADGRVEETIVLISDVTNLHRAEAALVLHARRLEALHRLSQRVNSLVSRPDQMLRHVAERSADLFEATVVVRLYDQPARPWVAADPSLDSALVTRVVEDLWDGPPEEPYTPLRRATRAQEVVVFNAITPEIVAFSPRLARAIAGGIPISALAIIPFTEDARTIGSLIVLRHQPGAPFTADEVTLAESLAGMASIAIRTAHLVDALEARSQQAEDAAAQLRRSVHQLSSSDAERQALLTRLIRTREHERSRIAAEIHDDSLQVLAAVGLRLQRLRRHLADPRTVELLDGVEETLDEATDRLRRLLFDLRPPALDGAGLAGALEELAEMLFDQQEGRARWRLDDRLPHRPPPAEEAIIYRIVREAMTNAAKHAHCTGIVIELSETAGGAFARVQDDGVGFRPGTNVTGHFGLVQMREHAELAGGVLGIQSTPGAGTTVELRIPYGDQRVAAGSEPDTDIGPPAGTTADMEPDTVAETGRA